MKYIKLLFLLIGLNGILCAQHSIQDSIYYTDKQDINCLRCLQTEVLKDSLISQYKANELTADTIIYQLQSNINDLNDLNTEQGKKITRLRWNVLKVGVIGLLSGFLAAIILI